MRAFHARDGLMSRYDSEAFDERAGRSDVTTVRGLCCIKDAPMPTHTLRYDDDDDRDVDQTIEFRGRDSSGALHSAQRVKEARRVLAQDGTPLCQPERAAGRTDRDGSSHRRTNS